jgi:hypothetical protein
MIKTRIIFVCCLAAFTAGCFDFIEPEFAEENAGAVMQINARIDDKGNIVLSGLLVPGLNSDGFLREVVRDTLYVFGVAIPSDTVRANGTREYSLSAPLGADILTQPFTIDPPRVEGIAVAPQVRWFSPRPLDPDTIRIDPGEDLVLHIARDSAAPTPNPVEQWLLEMTSGSNRFQISANGPPPTELLIPATWIPEPVDSVVRVRFTSFQSTQLFLTDYRGAYSYTVQFDRTVVIQ